jgi:long-chain acyl-CoA synthetase
MIEAGFVSVEGVVASHGRHRSRRVALVIDGESVDWQALNARIDARVVMMSEAGLRTGDRVATLTASTVDAVALMLATMRAGAIFVPLSTLLSPEIVARLIDDATPTLIFTDTTTAGLAADAFARCSAHDAARCLLDNPMPPNRGATATQARPEAPCNIIYSSGTTGTPKGIVHTHMTRLIFAMSLAIEFRITSATRTLVTTPLYTNGTWVTLFPTLYAGGTTIFRKFAPGDFLDTIERERITHALVVPTQMRMILDEQARQPRDVSSLRIVITSAAPLPLAEKQRAIATFGPVLMELYGQTEGVGTTLKPEDMIDHAESVGTPIAGLDMIVVDGAGEAQPPGAPGEICGAGAGLMAGYYNQPILSAASVFEGPGGGTYLRTGDIGFFDDAGFLHVIDRKKDMIISGGLNVFPGDIETVLREHPDVVDVAVIGIADEHWGEVPFAVLRASRDDIDPEPIVAWANVRLAKFQRLAAAIVIEGDFPRNTLGKVLKNELRLRYADGEADNG